VDYVIPDFSARADMAALPANSNTSGLVAIVTGGARGLGRAMALGLLRNGHRVVVLHLPTSAAEMQELGVLAAREGSENRLLAIQSDVTQWEQCQVAVAKALDRFGALHGLVNNAGVGMQGIGNVLVGKRKPFYEVESDAWRRAVDVNVNGSFLMAKAVTPHLVNQAWGRIVNIETSLFTMMMDGFSPYGPSKAALESATVIWSKDLAGTGVTVNALAPGGPADTRMIPQAEIGDRANLLQPDVMVAPIVWLMSPQSDGVTGRRIIAKEWSAERLRSEPTEKIGVPAGW
jgi:NAD(P)-dependent dehydrogenase (short-subunit alcohol dehydrogenase family)